MAAEVWNSYVLEALILKPKHVPKTRLYNNISVGALHHWE